MGFAVSQHLRARHATAGNVLILGFLTLPNGTPSALYVRENGDMESDWIGNLQAEIHFDDAANDWKDDWEPTGPPLPVRWLAEEDDDDEAEADGDPTLPGPDSEDHGTGDGDPT